MYVLYIFCTIIKSIQSSLYHSSIMFLLHLGSDSIFSHSYCCHFSYLFVSKHMHTVTKRSVTLILMDFIKTFLLSYLKNLLKCLFCTFSLTIKKINPLCSMAPSCFCHISGLIVFLCGSNVFIFHINLYQNSSRRVLSLWLNS